jgi:hypothetical protein
MRTGVVPQTDRRRHVNDSFDKFCFLEAGHGIVTAFELVALQVIARF